MAFRLAQKPTFSIVVTVPVANSKGGYDKNTFLGQFLRTPMDELTEMRNLSNEDLVRSRLVGWELKDAETNEEVPFSKETLEALLQITPTAQCTAIAFWEGANGARLKN